LTSAAPRYDAQLVRAIARVDDPSVPIAETVRRLGVVADELGVPRPSYVHMRLYVAEHREREEAAWARRQAIREILVEAYWDATMGKLVDAYEIADRLKNASG
jgi:hypothetical protein